MPSSTTTTMGTWVFSGPGSYSTGSSVRTRVTLSKSEIVKSSSHALKKKRPHIWVPPTPFSASQHRESYGNFRYADIYGYQQNGVATSPSNALPDYNPSVNWTDLSSRAIIKALLQLKDQNVNYAQAFAERRQSANLVADTIDKFARGIPELRRGNVKGFADIFGFSYRKGFKGVRETWLETQYGWKPALSDVYGAMEDLRKKDLDEPQRYRITVRGSARDVFSSRFSKPSSFLSYGTDMACDYFVEYKRGTRVALTYRLDDGPLAQLASKGFTNPALLAWELLPLSMVYDWFVPIGSYLSALDADLGYAFVGGHRTDHYEFVGKSHSVRRTPNYYVGGGSPGNLYRWEASGHERYRKSVVRSVYTTSPLPRFPGFKNPFSLVHVGNALALLGSKVR